MKVKFIEVCGFRSFKDLTRFEFPSGFVVLTGRNGAGKSTVLDALDFALTGSINKYSVTDAKGGGLDDHIWWVGEGAAENHYVTVGFVEDDGEEFSITRSRERGLDTNLDSLLSRFCGGRAMAGNWLQTLMQTSLIRDETLAKLSLDLPEQARFTAVRDAIGALSGPNHANRIAALVQAANQARSECETRQSKAEGELSRALTSLTEVRSQAEKQADIGEAEAIIGAVAPDLIGLEVNRSESLRKRLVERKQSINVLSEAISRLAKLQEERRFFESDLGMGEVEVATNRSAATKATRDAARARLENAQRIEAAEKQNDALVSQLVALLGHGESIGLQNGHCPLCASARSAQEFGASISAARAKLSMRGKRIAALASEVRTAQGELQRTEKEAVEAEQKLAGLLQRRDGVARDLGSIELTFERWGFAGNGLDPEDSKRRLLLRQEETAKLEHALLILEASSVHDRVTAMETRVKQLRTHLEDETAKLTEAERAVEVAKQIEKAAKGVSNQILTEQFDTVMPLLKELYQRLRPHTDWREIEMDVGGSVRASLNFTVGEGRNPQFLFSSGQRRAAGIAFLLAIHLSRPWCRLKSLLLDDPVQHIDDYRALNLVEVLSGVRKTGRQVIVAVEDPALADVLCRRLRSTTSEIGRRFEMSTSRNGSASIENQSDIYPLPRETLRAIEAS